MSYHYVLFDLNINPSHRKTNVNYIFHDSHSKNISSAIKKMKCKTKLRSTKYPQTFTHSVVGKEVNNLTRGTDGGISNISICAPQLLQSFQPIPRKYKNEV